MIGGKSQLKFEQLYGRVLNLHTTVTGSTNRRRFLRGKSSFGGKPRMR